MTEETKAEAAGANAAEAVERRCLASREVRPKARLLRFVVGPDGRLVPDLAEKLPGRGLWLTPQRDMIALALRRNLFQRAAKQALSVPESLADDVERLLRQRCLATLSLARRAGEAVAGHDKVRARLQAGRAAVLLEAGDGAEAAGQRMERLGLGVNPALTVARCFSAAELGGAMGRDQAVHLTVDAGGLAEKLKIDLGRLQELLASG